MSIDTITLTIAAENSFTDPVQVQNFFNISIGDPQGGVVTLQRRFIQTDGNWGNWLDVSSYTTATEELGFATASEKLEHRIGIKTGDYGAGNVTVRISQ